MIILQRRMGSQPRYWNDSVTSSVVTAFRTTYQEYEVIRMVDSYNADPHYHPALDIVEYSTVNMLVSLHGAGEERGLTAHS